jgi:hypothetical protein
MIFIISILEIVLLFVVLILTIQDLIYWKKEVKRLEGMSNCACPPNSPVLHD